MGTLDRFDEALLIAADEVGLPVLAYKRNRPQQKGGYRGKNSNVCPDMDACRAAIRKIAPRDYRMWDKYSPAFEARVQKLGPDFARRVQLFKKAVEEIQPKWKAAPRKQFICRYHPETAANVPALQLRNIRCPVPGGESLCQAFYAHRLFECPWQYKLNSTLADPLGCWRPSSGFV